MALKETVMTIYDLQLHKKLWKSFLVKISFKLMRCFVVNVRFCNVLLVVGWLLDLFISVFGTSNRIERQDKIKQLLLIN